MRLSEIARIVEGKMVAQDDPEISDVSSMENARQGTIVLATDEKLAEGVNNTNASAVVLPENFTKHVKIPAIYVKNPALCFIKITKLFHPDKEIAKGIHPTAILGNNVKIAEGTSIGAYVVIEDNVKIGRNCRLYPRVYVGENTTIGDECIIYANVVIYHNCQIANRVIIHSGSVIGSDGFGFVEEKGVYHKIPQIGRVVIQDDVELGANVTVDRARFDETVIAKGTKVDNMVHIGHSVKIGENCVIAAQTGIAGSTKIGKNVKMGGQVGIADHLQIGDNCLIAGRSGVTKNFPPGSVISGYPARLHSSELRERALIKKMLKSAEALWKSIKKQ